jgi:hypothetical protein
MCDPITVLYAATAVSALGQVAQGAQQNEMYKAQADQAELEGQTARVDARAQADKIRRAGRYQVGETKAQLAASGVKLGEGTPLEIEDDINKRVEEDAFAAVLSGERGYTSAMNSARSMRQAGSNAQTNSVLSAAGTVGQGWYLGKKA